MALNYAYNFAEIDPDTNMCVGVVSSDSPGTGNLPNYVVISVYDENYVCKYYINGEWYEDAEGTIPWRSALLD